MDELVAWLFKQIERTEQAAHNATPGAWKTGGLDQDGNRYIGSEDDLVATAGDADADHIILHSPEAALEGAKAQRAILNFTVGEMDHWGETGGDLPPDANIMGSKVVWALVQGYRNRPGYKREWDDPEFAMKH